MRSIWNVVSNVVVPAVLPVADPDRQGQPSRDAEWSDRRLRTVGRPPHLRRPCSKYRGMARHIEEFIRAQKIFLFHAVEVHAVQYTRRPTCVAAGFAGSEMSPVKSRNWP